MKTEHPAFTLIRTIAEDGSVCFQTFDDSQNKHANLARTKHGNAASLLGWLQGFNEAGAGVFWTVNETDSTGRREANIIRVRACFLDLDGSPLAPVLSAGLRPHAVVESSPGKWHVYWKLSDCGRDTFKPLQQALNLRFGGDPKVCDLPRVLRLPGFLHQKDKPFLSRLIESWDGPAYSVSAVIKALNLTLSQKASYVARETDPDEFHDRFKSTLPPSLMLIASGRVPSQKGFNFTAIQLVTAAHTSGVGEDRLVELCSGFIRGHRSDGGRYRTQGQREAELRRLYRYVRHHDEYGVRVAGIRSLFPRGFRTPDLRGL